MSDGERFSLNLADDAATRATARRMAPSLRSGDLVTLAGPIGAGKTEFCRALIRSLAGAEIEVPSPSYTLIQTYDLPMIQVAHVDLYRLSDASELAELGLDEIEQDHLVLLEWPERASGALPRADVELQLDIFGTSRRLTIDDRTGRVEAGAIAHE